MPKSEVIYLENTGTAFFALDEVPQYLKFYVGGRATVENGVSHSSVGGGTPTKQWVISTYADNTTWRTATRDDRCILHRAKDNGVLKDILVAKILFFNDGTGPGGASGFVLDVVKANPDYPVIVEAY